MRNDGLSPRPTPPAPPHPRTFHRELPARFRAADGADAAAWLPSPPPREPSRLSRLEWAAWTLVIAVPVYFVVRQLIGW